MSPSPQILTVRWLLTGEPLRLTLDHGIITSIDLAMPEEAAGTLAPGLCDLQINGYGGREFSTEQLTVEDVVQVTRAVRSQGVTTYLPTVTTHAPRIMEHAVSTIAQACTESKLVGQSVAGIHLEGPWISAKDGPRGAHPQEHVRKPDWAEFEALQKASGGRIRLVTLSPEWGDFDFIAALVRAGVVVGLGHLDATDEQILAAVEAGASLTTHLGNGIASMLPRHPNPIWTQLSADSLTASFIADGHHLPDAALKAMVRAKGIERTILVSDLAGVAGQPPGEYASIGGRVEVLDDGRVVVAGQRQFLAGAGKTLLAGVERLKQVCNLDLKTAWLAASERPRSLMGLTSTELTIGKPLVGVVIDQGDDGALAIRQTFGSSEAVADTTP
jgi:N-acetylglucosamine-6-phosphate deacetylase